MNNYGQQTTPDYTLYIREIETLDGGEHSPREKMLLLKQLLEKICLAATRNETLQFPNLFSQIVFVAQQTAMPRRMEWQLQNLRVVANNLHKNPDLHPTEIEYRQAQRAVIALCLSLLGESVRDADAYVVSEPTTATPAGDKLRVQITDIDRERKILFCRADNDLQSDVEVQYGVEPDNSPFDASIEKFRVGAQLNLVDCSIDRNGRLVPGFIVLEPDYLIDASAIAECFQDYCISPLHYFRAKFEEKENRSYLLLGNLANFFLDELVFAADPAAINFDEVFLHSFRQSPFEYTSCEDIRDKNDFREFMQRAKMQFGNIRRVVMHDFVQQDIDVHRCTLEPSFFSERFGFQGRLDMLQSNHDATEFTIVELKSGRLPFPAANKGKISSNHAVQIAVYRLMIESVYGKSDRSIKAAILYSSGDNAGENLRFAAVYHALEKAIVNMRNMIVANEYQLMQGDNKTVEDMFAATLSLADGEDRAPAFFQNRLKTIAYTLQLCTERERSYFFRFVRFVAKEIYSQKVGDTFHDSPTGVAALWNSNFADRAASLDVLYDLTIDKITDSAGRMVIRFNRNNTDMVNFREGEICIVYPRQTHTDTVLSTQILKGSISSITKDAVEVYFRYRQKNMAFFDNNRCWAIEHDTLDSSYNGMYRCLFAFLKSEPQIRQLLLGCTRPQSDSIPHTIDNHHEAVIAKALAARNYFLIVGPPGTGKTSIFARRLIEEYYSRPDVNIMIIAYTNRAVDELCEAVNAAFGCKNGECDKYIRIGTQLSCAEPYRHRLLQQISEKAVNRDRLRAEINNARICIATLASISGRQEIFGMKHFHVAIIDEASQILEPQIIGLLPRFDRFVMIGDHNQLATIVLQNQASSIITEPELCEVGITDCRDSLFERLLRTCIRNGWTDAFAQLTHQGRMHSEIAEFPATRFYDNNLFPALSWQTQPLETRMPPDASLIHRYVAQSRMLFFSTENHSPQIGSHKTSQSEATTIAMLAKAVIDVHCHNNTEFCSANIGIIAPYRNQIACIRRALVEADVPDAADILVDTVERFQGSQRDVILVSFCVNKVYQLDFLCNLNAEATVDRKLNVALTRARKQLFMTGNAQILRQHPIYASLLGHLAERVIILKRV